MESNIYEEVKPHVPAADPRSLNVVDRINNEAKLKSELPRLEDDHVCESVFQVRIQELESELYTLKNDKTITEFKSSLSKGGDITLTTPITITNESEDARNVIESDTTINFANNLIELDIPNATSDTGNWMGMNITGGNVVFNGTCGGIVTADNPELYAVVVRNGATLEINGGTYVGGTTALQSIDGIVTINGGFYRAQVDDKRYTLNCIDAAYREGKANFIVTGGTFVDFDPSNNLSEGPNTNYVTEGYKVISEVQDNGETWYTVVAE